VNPVPERLRRPRKWRPQEQTQRDHGPHRPAVLRRRAKPRDEKVHLLHCEYRLEKEQVGTPTVPSAVIRGSN
jgi:hypothetical protein